jgi:hypothetical protein
MFIRESYSSLTGTVGVIDGASKVLRPGWWVKFQIIGLENGYFVLNICNMKLRYNFGLSWLVVQFLFCFCRSLQRKICWI